LPKRNFTPATAHALRSFAVRKLVSALRSFALAGADILVKFDYRRFFGYCSTNYAFCNKKAYKRIFELLRL
jgi:hypothetical protein